jgi:hypothetical protein
MRGGYTDTAKMLTDTIGLNWIGWGVIQLDREYVSAGKPFERHKICSSTNSGIASC